jgi:hypothetical protein
MEKLPRSLIMWRCYSGMLAAAAVAGIAGALRLDSNFFWQLVWAACAWTALSALALALVRPPQRGVLWWTTLACLLASIILWTVFLVAEYEPEPEWLQHATRIMLGFAFVASIYLDALLLIQQMPRGGRWTKFARIGLWIALTAVAVAYTLMIVLANTSIAFDADDLFLWTTIPVILLTLLILWLPAALSMDAIQKVETLPRQSALLGQCPSCGTQQSFAAGGARCIKCGLKVNIEFAEPRCECGYLLYNLPGTVCPECGRDTAAQVASLSS